MVTTLLMSTLLLAGGTGLLTRMLMSRKIGASESYQQMAESAKSKNCAFSYGAMGTTSRATIDAIGAGDITGLYDGNGCVDFQLATRDFQVDTGDGAAADPAVCTITP